MPRYHPARGYTGQDLLKINRTRFCPHNVIGTVPTCELGRVLQLVEVALGEVQDTDGLRSKETKEGAVCGCELELLATHGKVPHPTTKQARSNGAKDLIRQDGSRAFVHRLPRGTCWLLLCVLRCRRDFILVNSFNPRRPNVVMETFRGLFRQGMCGCAYTTVCMVWVV